MGAPAQREMRFERKMTDAEAMMWNVEKDPWLSSNFGTVTILDQPVDFEIFQKRIASAVADIPRMRERVVPALGRLAPPSWQPDPEFRLDYHVLRRPEIIWSLLGVTVVALLAVFLFPARNGAHLAISSRNAGISGVTCVRTVGRTK